MKIIEKCPTCDHVFNQVESTFKGDPIPLTHPADAESFLKSREDLMFDFKVSCPEGHYCAVYFQEPEMDYVAMREEDPEWFSLSPEEQLMSILQ